ASTTFWGLRKAACRAACSSPMVLRNLVAASLRRPSLRARRYSVTDATNEQAQPAVPPQASAPVHADNYIVGMAAALLAYLSMAAMNVLAKLLSEHHHVIEIGFYRNLI